MERERERTTKRRMDSAGGNGGEGLGGGAEEGCC